MSNQHPKAQNLTATPWTPIANAPIPARVISDLLMSTVKAAARILPSVPDLEPDTVKRTPGEASEAAAVILAACKASPDAFPLIDLPPHPRKSLNRLLRLVPVLPTDKPFLAMELRSTGGQWQLVCVPYNPPTRPDSRIPPTEMEIKPRVDHNRRPVRTIDLATFRNEIRANVAGEWSDDDINAAVRARMLALDAVTPQRPEYQRPAVLSIDGPLMALAKRMRVWPECVQFLVRDTQLIGYLSCAPVNNENVFQQQMFYAYDRLPPAEANIVSRSEPAHLLYVSSIRLLPEARALGEGHTNRRALARGFERMLGQLAASSVLFDRIYVCTHHSDEDDYFRGLIDRKAHEQAERDTPGLPRIDPPLLRLHLRPWAIAGGKWDSLHPWYR